MYRAHAEVGPVTAGSLRVEQRAVSVCNDCAGQEDGVMDPPGTPANDFPFSAEST